MEKLLKIAELKDLENQVANGKISYGKMVEIINFKHLKELTNLRYTLKLKYEAERMYSEEEVIKIIYQLHLELQTDKDFTFMKVDEWFEQFKKK